MFQNISLGLILVAAFFQMGCSSSRGLNKKSDYKIARIHLKKSSPKAALNAYPKKENGGFITVTETSWLRLINGSSSDFKTIKTMGSQLPEKETTFLSKEASYFFYQKTAEGYFPAEHEVIVFHLVSAMGLLRQNKKEQAYVEAKRAAFYLQDDYVSHAGAFDHPFLRVWLSSLWVALGEWGSAQVDLRRASELSKKYHWAAELAKLQNPPGRWSLVFQGTGPEIEWDPKGLDQHLTGHGSLKFNISEHLALELQSANKTLKTFEAKTGSEMYKRHQSRNAVIRESLETSDYMLKSSSLHVGAGTAKGMATIANGTLKMIGLAVGGAIIAGTIYLLSQAKDGSDGTGEVATLGVGLGLGSFQFFSNAGSKIDTDVSKSVDKSLDNALDISKFYRFVRFIPDTIILNVGEKTNEPIKLFVPSENIERSPFLTVDSAKTRVDFFFQPL